MQSKNFAVFAWDHYYPEGGWNDLVGLFNDLEQARTVLKHSIKTGWRTGQIIDLDTGEAAPLSD